MGKGIKWEDRNKHQITKEQMDYRKKMAQAALDLCRAVDEIEARHHLTILDVLQLLHEEETHFLRAGLEFEEKERWEEQNRVG